MEFPLTLRSDYPSLYAIHDATGLLIMSYDDVCSPDTEIVPDIENAKELVEMANLGWGMTQLGKGR